jgi:SH3 domain-containing YSC84-like protein 1
MMMPSRRSTPSVNVSVGAGAGASVAAANRMRTAGCGHPFGIGAQYTRRRNRMRKSAAIVSLVLAGVIAARADLSTKERKRMEEAASVLREIRAAPDRRIPDELWDRARCVIVVPSLKKAAFVIGGEYGKGLMSCRRADAWTSPVFMEIGKGSWGLQIGAQTIDLVLLVMNERGMEKLLQDKVSLGAEASVAAGPVGRDARAATDAQMNAEILSYSRTQGLFAGINVSGGILRPDSDDNRDLYGRDVSPREVLVTGAVEPAPDARSFMDALSRQ